MTVGKSEYVAFLMRVCRLVIPDMDKERAKELAADDWAKDCRGSKTMSYKHFMDAVRRIPCCSPNQPAQAQHQTHGLHRVLLPYLYYCTI